MIAHEARHRPLTSLVPFAPALDHGAVFAVAPLPPAGFGPCASSRTPDVSRASCVSSFRGVHLPFLGFGGMSQLCRLCWAPGRPPFSLGHSLAGDHGSTVNTRCPLAVGTDVCTCVRPSVPCAASGELWGGCLSFAHPFWRCWLWSEVSRLSLDLPVPLCSCSSLAPPAVQGGGHKGQCPGA